MRERKCLNRLDQTLNRLYPASSLVQGLCSVQLSPCVNRAEHCLLDSKQRSGHIYYVSASWCSVSTVVFYLHPGAHPYLLGSKDDKDNLLFRATLDLFLFTSSRVHMRK